MTVNSVPPATAQQILDISESLGLGISVEEAALYADVVSTNVRTYDNVAALAPAVAATGGSSRTYRTPSREENANNAWSVRSSISESSKGRLAGRTVVIKDSIPVAGLPMLGGSNIFEGYVPEFDAEVVTRILADGGVIAGKAHCEYLCFSGASHTGVGGPIHNPWAHGRSTGGSSSGSAALVAAGEVDMALGADQAGSIRMPASFCGIVGLKPTYGLVPYTGIAPLDPSFDHVGPMTASVADAALLLSVIAGPDGVDVRQHGVRPGDYDAAMAQGVRGLRIGVLKEGFEVPGSVPEVGAAVRRAARTLESLGALVEDVSVPLHRHGLDIWATIGWTGMTETVLKGNGFGICRNDIYPLSMMEWARDHADGINQAPPSVKLFFLIAEHVRKNIGYVGYGRGQNAARRLTADYDAQFGHYDLLLMPTTPMTATPMPDASTTVEQELKTSHPMAYNTAPFDISKHPAMTLPCGTVDGLPVGLMLVAKHYDEASIFRAAAAYEATGEGRVQKAA